MKVIKVGVLGLGNIGRDVVKNFEENKSLIHNKVGLPIEIVKIADVDLRNKSYVGLDDSYFTTNAEEIINNPEIQIVVELIGGTKIAKEFILKCIARGKKVVTANKALLAECWREINSAVENEKNAEIFFEASVGGGIPIIKVLKESFVANRVSEITAIINGTANFILTEMENRKMAFNDALKMAQEKGFAEADPSLDIEGLDSAHKISILSTIAFGKIIDLDKVYVEGISSITLNDIEYAEKFGYKIKLLAIAKVDDGKIEVRVHPALLEKNHPLASVNGSYNAVYIKASPVGESMLYGKGAGGNPTSSAVISDIVDAAKSVFYGVSKPSVSDFGSGHSIAGKDSWSTRYYVRIMAEDKPGVLAKVSSIFAENNISISSVLQLEEKSDNFVPVIMMTHMAKEKNMAEACRKIEKLDCIRDKVIIIRVFN